MRAFIFPGQGSQAVGMGAALAESSAAARKTFAAVDDALGQNLLQTMRDGPADTLLLTENAQPAIMANAIATLRVLEREFGFELDEEASFVAGHSLGEYSALCAAGALDLATTARLLKLRGQAMQSAVPVGIGAMAALGVDWDDAVAVAAEAAQGEVCAAANDNAPGQVVISGHRGAVERAIEILKGRGVRRAMLLPVSAPFHCALMRPAALAMQKALDDADMASPVCPVFANVTAAPVSNTAEIKRLLVAQVTGVVRWRETVAAMMAAGVTHFVEIGGKVLTGMVRKIAPEAQATSLVSIDDIAAFREQI